MWGGGVEILQGPSTQKISRNKRDSYMAPGLVPDPNCTPQFVVVQVTPHHLQENISGQHSSTKIHAQPHCLVST